MTGALSATDRIVPELPIRVYVEEPEVIDRLLVRLYPDGRLYLRGTRARVEEFERSCIAAGIQLRIDYLALCG